MEFDSLAGMTCISCIFSDFSLTFLLEQMDKEEKRDLLSKQLYDVSIIVAVQAIFN